MFSSLQQSWENSAASPHLPPLRVCAHGSARCPPTSTFSAPKARLGSEPRRGAGRAFSGFPRVLGVARGDRSPGPRSRRLGLLPQTRLGKPHRLGLRCAPRLVSLAWEGVGAARGLAGSRAPHPPPGPGLSLGLFTRVSHPLQSLLHAEVTSPACVGEGDLTSATHQLFHSVFTPEEA